VEVAEPIILFVNYLIVIIDHSRSPFEKEAYIQQVFDPSFTESAKYADLMVEEIPVSKKWDILIEVYRRKGTTANPNKLRYFMAAILGKLSTEEQAQFCDIVSDELKATNIEAVIRTIFQIMPVEYWCKYSERARMRTEGRVIDSIRSGKHDATQGKCLSGAFATWARDCMEHFVLKEELTAALVDKLGSSDRQEQDYVLAYFFKTLLALQPVPSWLLIQHFRDGLKASNTRFRNALAAYNWGDEVPWMDTLPEGWQKALKKDYESFVETSEVAFDQGITDDDVPF
jgi:hypothetical protein